MAHTSRCVITAIGLVSAGLASAAPQQVSESAFHDHYSNEHLLSEAFAEYPEGLQSSPFAIVNGTYIGTGSVDVPPWCDIAGTNKCLDTQIGDGSFQAFPDGTTMWTSRLYFSTGPQTILATVVGNGGTLQINLDSDGGASGGKFVGFHDSQGLQSVSFHIVDGTTNYAFDDVTTSASVPLEGGATSTAPIPTLGDGVLALLAATMSFVGFRAIRRTGAH